MNAQHWRSIQLYGHRNVLRLIAAAAFGCLLIARPDELIQLIAGIALSLALYYQFRAGKLAREIDEASANLVFETDLIRHADARERLDSLVIQSRFNFGLSRKPIS